MVTDDWTGGGATTVAIVFPSAMASTALLAC
jgi:hypothetical protein